MVDRDVVISFAEKFGRGFLVSSRFCTESPSAQQVKKVIWEEIYLVFSIAGR